MIKKILAILKLYFEIIKQSTNFKGRSTRKEFWLFYVLMFVISYLIVWIQIAAKIENDLVFTIFLLVISLPWLALMIRRYHDTGHSGWWFLVPFANALFLFYDSQPRENKYGPDPKASYRSQAKATKISKPLKVAMWLVGALALAGLVYLDGRPREITAEEKKLLVTLDDLSCCVADFNLPASLGHFVARSHFDGSKELEYEFNSTDDPEAKHLVINSAVEITRSTRDAQKTYDAYILGFKLGGFKGGFQLKEDQSLFTMGDEHFSAQLEKNGKIFGNIVAVRQGKMVHSFIIAGLYTSNRDQLEGWLRLASLNEQPTRTPEETLEGFTEALERNDLNGVLSLVADHSRGPYSTMLSDADLPAMAADLRKYPPQRWDISTADETYASFRSKQSDGVQLVGMHITLHIEDGNWKIVSF